MIREVLGFLLLRPWFGPGGGLQPSPGPAPGPAPAPIFPVQPPQTLPPFPGPGWCYDEPPPAEVVSRAFQLLDTLWGQGQGAKSQEMTGGRWITYVAELVAGGKKGVTAYRSVNCPAAPPSPAPVVPPPSPAPGPAPAPPPGPRPAPAPQPAPGPAPSPSPPPVPPPAPFVGPPSAPTTPLQLAAIAMNADIVANVNAGKPPFRKRSQALYKKFQSASGGVLKVDGFPGTSTMNLLEGVLSQVGVTVAPAPRYPWTAAGGWNHPNAPTLAEWNS